MGCFREEKYLDVVAVAKAPINKHSMMA